MTPLTAIEIGLVLACMGGSITYLLLNMKKKPATVADKKEEVKLEDVPGQVDYQILREDDLISKKENDEAKVRGVVSKTGRLKRTQLFMHWPRQKRTFYANHIIRETYTEKGKTKRRYIVRWKITKSEAMDAQGHINYDESLENFLSNNMVSDVGKGIVALSGIISELMRDRSIQLLFVLAFVFGLPIGFNYNAIFHWVPNTVVHWVPRA